MTVLPDSQIGEGLGVAFIRKLGEGSFGQVYLARDLQTEQVRFHQPSSEGCLLTDSLLLALRRQGI